MTAPRHARLMHSPLGTIAVRGLRLAYRRRGTPQRWHARTFWGQRMEVRIPELMSERLVRFGLIEPDVTAYLLALLRPGQTFIDVGAHYGYYSLLGSYLIGPRGQVQAFEPTPSTREILLRNTAAIPTVQVSPCAVWSGTGHVTLHDFGQRLSAFNSIFSPRLSRAPKGRTLRVPTTSLDEFCAEYGLYPNLVKIDAESSESRILAGMINLLTETRVALTVEVGDSEVSDVPKSADVLSSVLHHNYSAIEYREGRLCRHELRDHYEYENILLLPREARAWSSLGL
jgi:FkbM family methyltransferase